MKTKFSLHSLLNNNKFILLVSFVIAVAIWLSVSPQRERFITCHKTIDITNSSVETLGLKVIDEKEYVINVAVSGKWYNISELDENDIEISYLLSGIVKPGEYEIPITATSNSSAFTIDSVQPDSVTVNFDYIETKELTITPIVEGITAKDGHTLGAAFAEQSVIEITGPSKQIQKVKKAVATVTQVEQIDATTSYTCEIQLLNKKDKPINLSKLTLPFKTVDVVVPINITKTVMVEPTFKNVPTSIKVEDIKYTLSTTKVEITGTKEKLDQLDRIELNAVSYKKATKETVSTTLNLPEGVSLTQSVGAISVKISK